MNIRPLDGVSNFQVSPLPARTAIFVLPIDVIPMLIGRLERMRQARPFEPIDAINMHNLLGETIMSLLKPVTGFEQLYRLLDTSLNGVEYTSSVFNGEVAINPPIPEVPTYTPLGVLGAANRIREALNTLVIGTTADDTLGSFASLETRLNNLANRIRDEQLSNADIIEELVGIAALLA